MKIRIKGNALRYRLTRSEVEQFALTGQLQEKINFGNNALYYSLHSSTQEQLSASFTGNHITVYIPENLIDQWITTDQVGFEHRMQLEGPEQETLYLLVEKDFTCMDKVDEDQRDHYPNPLLKHSYEQ